MAKYECKVCGYTYDEAKGIPEAGIAPGTKWEDLPEGWVCPLCGAVKVRFRKQEAPPDARHMPQTAAETADDMQELTSMQLSALCTNLARGCEKQYKPEEAALFEELSAYFRSVSAPAENPSFDGLLALVEQDLKESFPSAHAVSSEAKDRGALRALVWSEKVTLILSSLLTRYQKQGDAMLANTGVYVCTICGFIYIGNSLPEICPVCKVPNWKFEQVEGEA